MFVHARKIPCLLMCELTFRYDSLIMMMAQDLLEEKDRQILRLKQRLEEADQRTEAALAAMEVRPAR